MCASHLPTNTVQTYASHSRAVPPKCNSIRPLAHASELQVAARLGTVSQSGRVAERKEWHKQLKTAATTRQAWQHWCLVIEWWKIRARRRRGRYTRQSQQSHDKLAGFTSSKKSRWARARCSLSAPVRDTVGVASESNASACIACRRTCGCSGSLLGEHLWHTTRPHARQW